MNIDEAYRTLSLKPSASDEEIKKQFRKLSKEFHPDRNKDKFAEDKFKKISAANDVLKNRNNQTQPFNPFSGFHVQQEVVAENVSAQTSISFVESVLGCKKEIKYKRKSQCVSCRGQGHRLENNGCAECHGTGMKTQVHSNAVFRSTCDKCHGRQKTSQCTACYTQGIVNSDVNLSVSIPPGVLDGNVLRLHGMGNYVNGGFIDHHTDLHLSIAVGKHASLSIDNKDVVCTLDISLKEAIMGCEKNVETIQGTKKINVPKMSKNKEEFVLPNLGVARVGNQRVIYNVSYPENIEEMVK